MRNKRSAGPRTSAAKEVLDLAGKAIALVGKSVSAPIQDLLTGLSATSVSALLYSSSLGSSSASASAASAEDASEVHSRGSGDGSATGEIVPRKRRRSMVNPPSSSSSSSITSLATTGKRKLSSMSAESSAGKNKQEMSSPLQVDMRVSVEWGAELFDATITAVNSDGTVCLLYGNGEEEERADPENIKVVLGFLYDLQDPDDCQGDDDDDEGSDDGEPTIRGRGTRHRPKGPVVPEEVRSIVDIFTSLETRTSCSIDNLVRSGLGSIIAAETQATATTLSQKLLFQVFALIEDKRQSSEFDRACLENFSTLHPSAISPFCQKNQKLVLLLLRVAKIGEYINGSDGSSGWTALTARGLSAGIESLGGVAAFYDVGVGYSKHEAAFSQNGGNVTYRVSAKEEKLGMALLGILLCISSALGCSCVFASHTLGNRVLQADFPFVREEAEQMLKGCSMLELLSKSEKPLSKRGRKGTGISGGLHLSQAGVGDGFGKAAMPLRLLEGGARALLGGLYDRNTSLLAASAAAVSALTQVDSRLSSIVCDVVGPKAVRAFLASGSISEVSEEIKGLVSAGLIARSPSSAALYQQLEQMLKDCQTDSSLPLPPGLPNMLGSFSVQYKRLPFEVILEKITGEVRVPARSTLTPEAQLAEMIDDIGRTGKPMKDTKTIGWVYFAEVFDQFGQSVGIYPGSTGSIFERMAVQRPSIINRPPGRYDDALTAELRRRQGEAGTLSVYCCEFQVEPGTLSIFGDAYGLYLYAETKMLYLAWPLQLCLNGRPNSFTRTGGFSSSEAKILGEKWG